MNDLQKFLASTKRELVLQLLFVLFAIIIPNQKNQLAILIASIVLINLLLGTKPNINISIPKRLNTFFTWVAIASISYLMLPYAWLWGLDISESKHIDLMFPLFCFSVFALVIPPFIAFRGNIIFDVGSAPIVSVFGWIIGLCIPYFLGNSGIRFLYVAIPLAIIIVTVSDLTGGVAWMIANLISGAVYAHFLSNLSNFGVESLLSPQAIFFTFVASLSSATITGLAYIVFLEKNRS
jgi:hypothetical protein